MTSRPNYLRSETSTDAEQYRQAGATSATTVKAPKEIYEAMQKMREKTNTGPGRQLLEALRHDPLGGDPYDGDTDTPASHYASPPTNSSESKKSHALKTSPSHNYSSTPGSASTTGKHHQRIKGNGMCELKLTYYNVTLQYVT